MSSPHAPRLDDRRAPEFSAELAARAHAWIAEWGLADGERDFGSALLEIAARFNSEVAERLDGAGEKMRRGFLDWLAVRGEAARPARMPVVFKLADTARDAVLASAPVRMQAEAAATQVVFETEKDVRVVPGRIDVVVGADPKRDAFYLPPPGLSDLDPLEPLPTEWRVKSFASAGETKLQLDPELGLSVAMLIEADGKQYTVREVDNGLVTIDRKLESDMTIAVRITKVSTFNPFGSTAYNSQEHSLYLGDSELLNLEADATIEVVGAPGPTTAAKWEYWGKVDGKDEVKWQELKLVKAKPDRVVLQKSKGALEERNINGRKSRWIRGVTKQLTDQDRTFAVDELRLCINCLEKTATSSATAEAMANNTPLVNSLEESATSSATAEAMANTTPLVISEPFYPLGREPRQFDAFYLGCSEAFSKKGAKAKINLEMSDATCQAYVVVRGGPHANKVLAGVGKDRALHLFQLNDSGEMAAFHEPLRPPLPAAPDETITQSAPIDLNLGCRPVIWSVGNDFFVAVAALGNIWVWHENNNVDAKQSGWKHHSTVPDLPGIPAEIEDIVILKSSPSVPGAVLSKGLFWVFNGSDWIPHPTLRPYKALVPIYTSNGELTDSMVAVGAAPHDHLLYQLKPDGTESLIALGVEVDAGVRPAAIQDGSGLRVVAVSEDHAELVAVNVGSGLVERKPLGAGVAIGAAITYENVAGKEHFFVGEQPDANSFLVAAWVDPFGLSPTELLEVPIPNASGEIGGTPSIAEKWIIVPGSRGDAFVAQFNQLKLSLTGAFGEGIRLRAPAPFVEGNIISVRTVNPATRKDLTTIAKALSGRGTTDLIYVAEPGFGESIADNPLPIEYPAAASGFGRKTASTRAFFTLDAPDGGVVTGKVLRIEVQGESVVFCRVVSRPSPLRVRVAAATPLPQASGPLSYWKPIGPAVANATAVSTIELQPAEAAKLDAEILPGANLYFDPPADPPSQRASAFGVIGSRPNVIVLATRWTNPPRALNTEITCRLEFLIGAWRRELSDITSNPALSWEYWNGKGWWSLQVLDGTRRLASSGDVTFTVPQDIAESDWSGKTNYWIRCRLVGGDFGREEVTVISKPGDPGETVQTVKRSTDGIRAPLILSLDIRYSICDALFPAFVLAEDGGTIRDESDANRTTGAIVEAFVPLAVALGRLSKSTAAPEQPEVRSPGCDCGTQNPASTVTQPVAVPSAGATPRDYERALYIGLTASLTETPVNVLLLVAKGNNYSKHAPMTVMALVAGQFVPITADDTTRALGESGVLSMSFALPPTRSTLFGKENLTWLRLSPKSPSDEWLPTLRGAYLNAVWASATETLTRELLGSSDGSPNLTVRLARPPVLRNTLELRVREPLGEEERAALHSSDGNSVLSEVDGLPGDWVLWTQVTDPDDQPATERVYALDEANGEIRFGDGRHGRIPPIGRDTIVAFRYCRTEPGPEGGDNVPGNTVAARTALNLVSPVETVESVIVADQAAGGAPSESDDRVLRFGFARLRHRNRAVTAHDIEDLALQSSPDIVQARAFARRGSIRLVVVMRGKNPRPNAAQVRELRRLLLAAAPMSLSATGALRIEGPAIRRLRIELVLRVETLDHAGALTDFVKKQLVLFFDTATGGVYKTGWPLGLNPSEGDIVLALIDAPFLESIERVDVREIADDDSVLPSLETLKATEIAMLADDPIRITFETAEVMK